MKKLLPLIFLSLLSCNLSPEKENKISDNKYIAKGNFGTLEISITELDSIITSHSKLSEYKTSDSNNSIAAQILIRELRKENQEVKKYLIVKIIKNKDQTITFHLDHIDAFVYSNNLELNANTIPITGNATGFEGWYTVDMNTDKISIIYAQ